MHFKRIPNSEIQALSANEYKYEKFRFGFNSGKESINITSCRKKDNDTSYYYTEKIKKEKIVLHFTAGHLQGDLKTLMQNNREVSVSYIISRDGEIIQLFNPKFWSYHLGRGSLGGNKIQSKKSIAIELSNYGYLVENGDSLETWHSKPEQKDTYCTKNDSDQYICLDNPFRSKNYFADYTYTQYESLIVLLRYLTEKFKIPKQFLPENLRYQTTQEVVTFKGIVSHINFRESGKWDIGPAFNWGKIMSGLRLEDEEEMATKNMDTLPGDNQIKIMGSEDQIDELFPYKTNNSDGDELKYGEDGPEI